MIGDKAGGAPRLWTLMQVSAAGGSGATVEHRERQTRVSAAPVKSGLRRAEAQLAPVAEEATMNPSTIFGLVPLAVGVLLLFFAWQTSNAPVNQMAEALTGRYTDNTMLYLIGGVIGVVVGLALLYRDFSRR